MKPDKKVCVEDIQWNTPDIKAQLNYNMYRDDSPKCSLKLGMGFTAHLFKRESFHGNRTEISGSIWHGDDLITYLRFMCEVIPVDEMVVLMINAMVESGKIESKKKK